MSLSRRALLEHVGVAGAISLAGCYGTSETDLPGRLTVEWTSDTASEYDANHHAMATVTVDGQPVVGVPRNGFDGSEHCSVVALDAAGDVLWSNPLPPEHCNAHAIGDVGEGDLDGDDRPEFLAATETAGVFAYDAVAGEETFREDVLDSIGYSAPVVADLTGDGTPELVVVDFAGNLSVVRADGSVVWTRELDQPVYVTPIVADLVGDGALEVAVYHGRRPSEIACFDRDGEIVWRSEQEHLSLTWSLLERETGRAIAAAVDDTLVVLDGNTGERRWATTVGEPLRVGGSDRTSIYTTARDGAVRALDTSDGEIRWTGRVTEEGVRMSAPITGAVTGDPPENVVATAFDGTVSVLDAEGGELLARRRSDADIYTGPLAADVTGDGRDEVIVLYGDGRVAALSYESEAN